MTLLGEIERLIVGLSVLRDLTRSAIIVVDYRADAWANQVVVR